MTPDQAATVGAATYVDLMSAAHQEWTTRRADRLDQLLAAHDAVAHEGRGRQWQTGQINAALIVRIATEFQGFSRALHDEAVDYVIGDISTRTSAELAATLRSVLTSNRQLESKNAQPSSLGADFGRLGFLLWPSLATEYPHTSLTWNRTLAMLNTARNAIAHDDEAKLTEVAALGWPTTQRRTAERFRRGIDGLADAMDNVVSQKIQALTGGPRPW